MYLQTLLDQDCQFITIFTSENRDFEIELKLDAPRILLKKLCSILLASYLMNQPLPSTTSFRLEILC
ncbi:hypothetical protein SAMD00079811_06060 [Scytonema sp. HK-05]|nr:hypothetical protein SAMD00079811_06060 [Scytonema sp. HK-05]